MCIADRGVSQNNKQGPQRVKGKASQKLTGYTTERVMF